MRAPSRGSVGVDLNTGVQHHGDGSITVPIDPPLTTRKYKLANGIVIPDSIHPELDKLAKEYQRLTGKTLTVTSAVRPPGRQARAMYDKFASGDLGYDYRNRVARNEIYAAFKEGRKNNQSRDQTIKDMARVFDSQVKRGTYISLHMNARAIDVRINPKTASKTDKSGLFAAAKSLGAKVHFETKVPHAHIQFPAVATVRPGQ